MATLLATFFSFIVGVIAGSGLGLGFLWASAVSLAAYFGAKPLIARYIGTPPAPAPRHPHAEPAQDQDEEAAADARAYALRQEYRASGFSGTYVAWLEDRASRSRGRAEE